MESLVFTQLSIPEVKQLFRQELETFFSDKGPLKEPDVDRWLDLEGLCNYLPEKPAKPTVYGWIAKGLIPHYKKSKALSFLKSEIDAWLKTGRKQTASDIDAAADASLKPMRKRHFAHS